MKWWSLALLSLTCSFAFNWAIAPMAYLPDADSYYSATLPKDVKGQLEHFYRIWDDPARCEAAHRNMHRQNPEWDLISRTFLAYSLANVALGYPSECKRAMHYLDKIIDDTMLRDWRSFLLPYGFERPFVRQPASSIMVDGELSLMLGLRRLVKDSPDYRHRELHRQMVERCVAAMETAPLLCAESYPDECWLWCNPLALLSIHVFDILENEDHSSLIRRWEETARSRLLDAETGLMPSAVTLHGRVLHPPEGSTIWIGAYCLAPILPDLAREQYGLMKKLLSGNVLFVSYGREWPKGRRGNWDIDSGFTPFGMGPASTGFALVAAKQMGDRDFFRRLLGLLNIVGVPRWEDNRMRYLSSNLVGDATFLLAKTSGPAWLEIRRRSNKKGASKCEPHG